MVCQPAFSHRQMQDDDIIIPPTYKENTGWQTIINIMVGLAPVSYTHLYVYKRQVHSLWARRHGTKFNGAPYIIQKAAMAVYSDEGKAQLKEQVGYYCLLYTSRCV